MPTERKRTGKIHRQTSRDGRKLPVPQSEEEGTTCGAPTVKTGTAVLCPYDRRKRTAVRATAARPERRRGQKQGRGQRYTPRGLFAVDRGDA